MAYKLIMQAGGYWSSEDKYIGGDTHSSENDSEWQITKSRLKMWVLAEGYSENMDLFSYFECGIERIGKKNLVVDEDFEAWNQSLAGQTVRHIYVVRSDDPNLHGFRVVDSAAVDGERDGESDGENDGESDGESDSDIEAGELCTSRIMMSMSVIVVRFMLARFMRTKIASRGLLRNMQ